MTQRSANSKYPRRQGITLVFTVGVVTVLLALGMMTTRSMVSLHQQRRMHEQSLQATFLAESGVERAIARLALSPKYQGETWNLQAESDNLPGSATVTISIRPTDKGRELNVAVLYDVNGLQTSAERNVLLPGEKSSP